MVRLGVVWFKFGLVLEFFRGGTSERKKHTIMNELQSSKNHLIRSRSSLYHVQLGEYYRGGDKMMLMVVTVMMIITVMTLLWVLQLL